MSTKWISFIRLKIDILIFTEAKCGQHAGRASPATLGKGDRIRSIKVTIETSWSIVSLASNSSIASHRAIGERSTSILALSRWFGASLLGHHGLIKRWRLWCRRNHIRHSSFSLLVMISCNRLQSLWLHSFRWRKVAWCFATRGTWEGCRWEKPRRVWSLKSLSW